MGLRAAGRLLRLFRRRPAPADELKDRLAVLTRDSIAGGVSRRETLLAVQHEGWRVSGGDRDPPEDIGSYKE